MAKLNIKILGEADLEGEPCADCDRQQREQTAYYERLYRVSKPAYSRQDIIDCYIKRGKPIGVSFTPYKSWTPCIGEGCDHSSHKQENDEEPA